MSDAGGELAERGELFRLHEPVLRLAQVGKRGLELARARLHFVEQARIFDRDQGLVGEGLHELDLAPRKLRGFVARQTENALDAIFAKQRHPEQCAGGGDVHEAGKGKGGIGEHVLDGQRPAGLHHARNNRPVIEATRIGFEESHGLGRMIERCVTSIQVAVAQVDGASVGLAQVRSGGQQRIGDALQIKRRPTDDLEDVGGRGLLRQRFLKLARARAHLFKQPRILDGDHRLIGKGAQDFHVARRKGPRLGARRHDGAHDLRLAHQRHGEQRARGTAVRGHRHGVILLQNHVFDLFRLPRKDRAARGGPTGRRVERMRYEKALKLGARFRPRHAAIAEEVSIADAKRARRRLAQIDGGGDERLEDRVEIEGGTADDL